MKMVMMIIEQSKREELEIFLDHSGVAGYTELSGAAGKGASGLRLGSRAFPRTSSVVFSLLDDSEVDRLADLDGRKVTVGDDVRLDIGMLGPPAPERSFTAPPYPTGIPGIVISVPPVARAVKPIPVKGGIPAIVRFGPVDFVLYSGLGYR